MSTKFFSILTICSVCAAGLIWLIVSSESTTLNTPLQNNARQQETQDTSNVSIQAEQNAKEEQAETYSERKQFKSKQTNIYAYEDDWCSIYSDLHGQDKKLAQLEMKEASILTGDIAMYEASDGYIELGDVELIKPYKEIALDQLMDHVQNNDVNAIIATLSRRDVSFSRRTEVAKRALMHGMTGEALTLLVMESMIEARRQYRINGNAFNDKVKLQVQRALAYALYGVERYSIRGIEQLSNMLELDNGRYSDIRFQPALSFTSEDFDEVSDMTLQIKQKINEQRLESAMAPLDEDIPKIIKHKFERDLARLYAFSPMFTNRYAEKLADRYPQITKNDCVAQYVKLFSGK